MLTLIPAYEARSISISLEQSNNDNWKQVLAGVSIGQTEENAGYQFAMGTAPSGVMPAQKVVPLPFSRSAREERKDQKILNKALAETRRLLFLTEGWNGYDALPPSPAVVKRAIDWFGEFYGACQDAKQLWHWPCIEASAEGEVVYEWWSESVILTVYVETERITFSKFGRNDSSLREHGMVDNPADAVSLMRWFGENCIEGVS